MKQNNSGVKGNTNTHQMDRESSRELKRAEPNALRKDSDICDSIVKSEPFSKSSARRIEHERSGGQQMGMGKAKISSDSRTQDLISDKNPRLDIKRDRMEEHGGITSDTDMTKGRQGNTLAQPSDGKGKYNRGNDVANSDDSI